MASVDDVGEQLPIIWKQQQTGVMIITISKQPITVASFWYWHKLTFYFVVSIIGLNGLQG